MTATKQSNPKPKLIANPRRLLILTPSYDSNHTIPVLLHSLTGVAVTPQISSTSPAPPSTSTSTSTSADKNTNKDIATNTNTEKETEQTSNTNKNNDNGNQTSFAGYTTHAPFQITNKYYSADVPIWVDEIPLPPPATSASTSSTSEEVTQWKTSFLSNEAREVRDAIGAILLCVRNPKELISRAVPREAFDHGENDGNIKEPSERGDVQIIKELVRTMSELKNKIEEERSGGNDIDELVGQMQSIAEVPGILVLIDDHNSSSSTTAQSTKEEYSNGKDEDDDLGLEISEPFASPWWEDILFDIGIFGFEIISWTPTPSSHASSSTTTTSPAESEEKRNMYGELEGLPRIKEILSTHEWEFPSLSSDPRMDGDGGDDDDDDIMSLLNRDDDGESTGFRFEVNQLEREMMGLRFAINRNNNEDDEGDGEHNAEVGDGEEIDVDNLESLMMRMRAIKDISADLPENKRKEFAAKAVRDIMREL